MNLSFDQPTPLGYFASLVESDSEFALFEAAVSLGQDEYPEMDVQTVLGEVDQLLERARRRLAADSGPVQKLRILNQFFFQDLGFAGNVNDFYDPDNSFIHRLLQSRRGIPIALAVLWMELAQGIGLQARGIGFPGHFLVKVTLPRGQVVIDPMNGQSLGREDLSERLEPFKLRSGLVDDFDVPLGLYLQAETPRNIIARMLRNLKEVYRAQSDWHRLVSVLDRLIVLLPEAWGEYRDRGLALAEQGLTREALLDLEIYLTQARDALDVDAIAERVANMRLA